MEEQKKVGRYTLEEAINDSWIKTTSSDPENWTPENPAFGQCAVTACVVQDYLGGEILNSRAKLPDGKEISHYFNKVGTDYFDFTKKQFPEGTVIPPGAPKPGSFKTTREYIMSFEVTKVRYTILKRRVDEELF